MEKKGDVMSAHLRANLWLLGLTVLICCVFYPLALWTVGQGFFPDQASGSLIVEDGQVIGSRLIAQPFTRPEYFWPRPSAISYDASASGGSNLSANNPKLRNRVAQMLSRLDPVEDVPADFVMTSGSGLDPHITLKNAEYQLARVADAWAKRTGRDSTEIRLVIEDLLKEKTSAPLGGLGGVELINVLEVNLELNNRLLKRAKGNGGSA